MRSLQNHAIFFCTTLFFASLISFLPQSFCSEPLVGSWVSVERAKGGIRSIHQYQSDGTLVSSHSVMIGYFYQLIEALLVLTPAPGEEGEALKYTVKCEKASLILREVSGGVQTTLQRVSKEIPCGDQGGIVGTWSFRHSSGETGYYTFVPDGRLFFQIPLPGKTVWQYAIEDDVIVRRQGTSVERIRFEVNQDLLTLHYVNKGQVSTYKRTRSLE